MRLALRFSIPVCALLAGAAACTAIRTVQPADLTPPNPPARVLVTRVDHTAVVFDSALARGDSLVGVVNGQRQRLALSDVTSVSTREPSFVRTEALIVGGLVGGVVLIQMYLTGKPGPTPKTCVPCIAPGGSACCY